MHKMTVTACAFVMILLGAFFGIWSAVALSKEYSNFAMAFLLLGLVSFVMGVWMWGKGEEYDDGE